MNPRKFFIFLLQLALAGAILILSHYGYSWLAAVLVFLPPGYRWFRAGRQSDVLLDAIPDLIIGLAVVVLVGLSRPPYGQPVFQVPTQIVLTAFYAGWLIWRRNRGLRSHPVAVLVLQQALAVTAIFLAAAFWHWPDAVVVGLTWLTLGASTYWFLNLKQERAASLLSAAWGLVAAEIAWILNIWQVNYILGGGAFIIPQATLVVMGVGYCFASIYHTHIQKRLSRRRLIEYVAITGVLLAIVIAGTRWNGTV